MRAYPEVYSPDYSNTSVIARLEPLVRDRAPAAFNALKKYCEHTNQVGMRAMAHPMEVMAYALDFVGPHAEPAFLNAALLHDLGQRIDDPVHGEHALAALKMFSNDPNVPPDEWDQTAAFLADMDYIEAHAETVRTDAKSRSKDLATALVAKDKSFKVWPRLWMTDAWMTSLKVIDSSLTGANFESNMIKVFESMHNLDVPAPSDAAMLQDVFEAGAFYAPMAGFAGYDGPKIALNGREAIIRLLKSRKGVNNLAVKKAHDRIGPINDRAFIARAAAQVLNITIGGDNIVEHVIENNGDHDVIIGHSLLDVSSIGAGILRTVLRLKSEGSTALKIVKKGDVPDLLGITVVTPNDVKLLSSVFRMITKNVLDGIDGDKLYESTEKDVFDIRGGQKSFLDFVVPSIKGWVPANSLYQEPTTNGYETAKLTFQMPAQLNGDRIKLPVEIQVQTEEGRVVSRRGEAAHGIYKTNPDEPIDVSIMESIFQRKKDFVEGRNRRLVPASVERGRRLQERVRRSRGWSEVQLY